MATRQEYDKVIHETDSAYSKILESSQMLLTVLKRESEALSCSCCMSRSMSGSGLHAKSAPSTASSQCAAAQASTCRVYQLCAADAAACMVSLPSLTQDSTTRLRPDSPPLPCCRLCTQQRLLVASHTNCIGDNRLNDH